jgi:3-hydroxybutyryl-CoA dehydrogenase
MKGEAKPGSAGRGGSIPQIGTPLSAPRAARRSAGDPGFHCLAGLVIISIMPNETIKTVAVLGAGTMGNGVAHVFARSGYTVILRDVEQRFLDRGIETIAKNLDREVRKERITLVEKTETLERLKPTTDMAALGSADFAVEAVPEQLVLKVRVLQEADGVLRPGVILASNTSSISISKLAAETRRAEKFIGMHFFNPVPVMALVEVIRGRATSDDTFATTMALCEKLGKKPVGVNDAPGFVSNRVLMPMINEAAYAVMEGVATPEAVDAVMKLGMNHPMGPLELADLIGLDVCVDIMEVLHRGLGNEKYVACPLLRQHVAAGRLGRKSGQGFYKY